MKNIVLQVVFWVVLALAIFAGIWYATSAEVWYSGQHDAQCEKTLYGKPCHCYDRLVKADKENERK